MLFVSHLGIDPPVEHGPGVEGARAQVAPSGLAPVHAAAHQVDRDDLHQQ